MEDSVFKPLESSPPGEANRASPADAAVQASFHLPSSTRGLQSFDSQMAVPLPQLLPSASGLMATGHVCALEKVFISRLLLYQLPGEQFAYQDIHFVSLGSKKTLIKGTAKFLQQPV